MRLLWDGKLVRVCIQYILNIISHRFSSNKKRMNNAFHHMYLSLTKWRINATNRMNNNGKREAKIFRKRAVENIVLFLSKSVFLSFSKQYPAGHYVYHPLS